MLCVAYNRLQTLRFELSFVFVWFFRNTFRIKAISNFPHLLVRLTVNHAKFGVDPRDSGRTFFITEERANENTTSGPFPVQIFC